MKSDRGDRPAFLGLFVLLFLGWGVLSPFLPAVLAVQGASAPEIGLLLGLGVAVRLVAMPIAGRLADRWQAPRQVLAGVLAGAALCALGYWLAIGFLPLLLVGVLHAVATGPMGPLPDALAVRSAAAGRLDYGVVRGAGAAAFILANAVAGWAAGAAGSPLVLLGLNAALFGLAAVAALLLPRPVAEAILGAVWQALTNSVQHAGPSDAVRRSVRGTLSACSVEVVVEDDGRGFLLADVPRERLGIRLSILDRVHQVQGSARIDTVPGEGTRVVVVWPAARGRS